MMTRRDSTDRRPCARSVTHSISMIVPAFNEADNLVETIPQAIAVLEGMDVEYEVLVIDDGSTDGTPQVDALALRGISTPAKRSTPPQCGQGRCPLHRIRAWRRTTSS